MFWVPDVSGISPGRSLCAFLEWKLSSPKSGQVLEYNNEDSSQFYPIPADLAWSVALSTVVSGLWKNDEWSLWGYLAVHLPYRSQVGTSC